MIQACLNGARLKADHSAVPVSPAEHAADAIAVRQAGAECLHVHPRDSKGLESLADADIAAALTAIRDAVPGMPVGVSTADGIALDSTKKLAAIQSWSVPPDYASVNLGEADCFAVMGILQEKGIGIEAGIWTREDALKFQASPFKDQALRILIEIIEPSEADAIAQYEATMEALGDAGVRGPFLVHGTDANAWLMLARALEDGYDTRVGFEDMMHQPDGSPARSNTALLEAALSFTRRS